MKEKIEKDIELQNKIKIYNMVSKNCSLQEWFSRQKLGKRCKSKENCTGICEVNLCPIIKIAGEERKRYLSEQRQIK